MVAFEATSRPPFYYWKGGFYFIIDNKEVHK